MKEFVTAAKAVVPEDVDLPPDIEVKIDKRKITVMGPGPGQLSLLMSAVGDEVSDPQSVATMINFLFSMVGDEDRKYLKRRLMDRNDPFGASEVADVLIYLIEEWTGRPTKSSDDSSESPGRTGSTSTASARRGRTPTRSRSASTVS